MIPHPGIKGVDLDHYFSALLDDFISHWSSWFAVAAQGQLNIPGTMPERDPNGSWRRA